MKFKRLVNNKTLVFFFFLLLILLLKFPIINTPHTRDALTVCVLPSILLKNADFNPLTLGTHPPVYYELLGLTFKLFGESLLVGHVFTLILTFLLVFYTYLLGKVLYNSFIGFFAALSLFISPLVFAQSGMVHLDIVLAVFSIITVYYYVRDKEVTYLIFGSILVLTKEPGILIILGIWTYHFLTKDNLFMNIQKNKKLYTTKIKDLIIYAIPLYVLILWFLINKYSYGWIFHPSYIKFLGLSIFPQEFLRRLHQLFFVNYHFIITTAILIYLLPIKKFYNQNKKLFFLTLITPFVIFLLCHYVNFLLSFINTYLNLDLIKITGRNLSDFYQLKFSISYISFLILFLVLYKNQESRLYMIKEDFNKFFSKKTLVLIICIIIIILFFSFIRYGYQERYLILIYPFFFIIGIAFLKKLIKKQIYFVTVIGFVLFLFVIQWYDNSMPVFQTCEENMRYLDVIETHIEMSKFIEENYKDKVILTEVPQLNELQNPPGGYVSQPIKTIELEEYPYIRGVKKTLPIPTREKFDLVCFSNGGINEKQLRKIVDLYNLSLIKKFEKNGKITYLYGNE